jgi:hypothetical protein
MNVVYLIIIGDDATTDTFEVDKGNNYNDNSLWRTL